MESNGQCRSGARRIQEHARVAHCLYKVAIKKRQKNARTPKPGGNSTATVTREASWSARSPLALLVCLVMVLAMPALHGDTNPEPRVIDLPTVLRLARGRSLDIKIAAEQVKEAKANRDSAVFRFFPWLEPGAGYK